MRRTRRNHADGFKVKGALVAMKGHKKMAERSEILDIPRDQVSEWKQQFLESAAYMFDCVDPTKR